MCNLFTFQKSPATGYFSISAERYVRKRRATVFIHSLSQTSGVESNQLHGLLIANNSVQSMNRVRLR